MSPADSIDSSKFVSTSNCFATRPDDWSLATRVAIASITSQGTMGGLIVAGFVSFECLPLIIIALVDRYINFFLVFY